MSTLHQLWRQYCDNPNDYEISDILCKRVRKFARIVIRRFKINFATVPYEDLMQLAFVCFFNVAPGYKEGAGTLEGYFIYSFNSEVIKFIKNTRFYGYRGKNNIVDDTQNPLDCLIFDELNREIEDLLSSTELWVLNTYLKEGIYDERTAENEVRWVVASIRNKIKQYLDREK